jgi:hypothetical protein
MIPLYAFLQGDTLGLLILAEEEETVASLARKVVAAATVRVAPPKGDLVVMRDDRALDARVTVTAAGLEALDRIDVLPAPGLSGSGV